MDNRVDFTKYSLINEIAFQATAYLAKHCSYCQVDKQKVELSCYYLWRLVHGNDDDILSRIASTFADLGKARIEGLPNVVNIGSQQVHISQLIWSRLCVAAYFFYHDETAWQNLLFRKLEERVNVPQLRQDIQTAKSLIDDYCHDLQALSANTSVPKSQPAQVPEPQSASAPEPENVFSLAYQRTNDYQRLLEFLNAEKQDCSDSEWARYALAIYRCSNAFIKHPATFKKWLPDFCQMFGRDVKYQEPNKLDRTKNEKSVEAFLP